MKTFISHFICCCFTFCGYGQDKTSVLEAKGEMPEFLSQNAKDVYFVPDLASWQYVKKPDKHSSLDLIYSSNMIVFGDPISEYCTALLQKIRPAGKQVYAVRSNAVGTFSNERGDLFVTTGLISRLSYEAQLAFFLFRESELQQYEPSRVHYKNAGILTLEKLITLIGTSYTDQEVKEAEKAAFTTLRTFGYTEYEIASAYDLLLYKEAPFYEKQFNWAHFNTGYVFIPKTEYTSVINPKPQLYAPEKIYPDLVTRRSHLMTGYSKPSDLVPTVLVDSSALYESIRQGRMESVNLRIMSADFVTALYELYILESFGTSGDYLDLMKATAWWGIAKDRSREITKADFTEYEVSDNEGAYFSRYIKKQSTPVVLSMAFRYVYDGLKKYPESRSYTNMLNDLVRMAQKTGDFPLRKFHKYDYAHLTDSLSGISGNGLNNEFVDRQNQQINVSDTLKSYYLYLLPDFVSDDKMIQLFGDSVKAAENYSDRVLEYATFSFRPYKKGRTVNEKKKEKLSIDRLNNDLSASNITINKTSGTSTLDEYREKYWINYTIFQNYYYNRFTSPVLPVKSDAISGMKTSGADHLLGIGIYNHAYRPQLRSFHLLGLAGVTLPYIIPELFFRGHKTQIILFVFDPKTGDMIDSSNRKYNDSFSYLNIQNDILNSSLNILNQ